MHTLPELRLPTLKHMDAVAALRAATDAWESACHALSRARKHGRPRPEVRAHERAEVRAARRVAALRRILGA